MQVIQGDPATLELTTTTYGGALVDAGGLPALTVQRPNGSSFATPAVTRISLGFYRATITIGSGEPLGTWTAVWDVNIQGFDSTVEEPFDLVLPIALGAGLYGSSLAGVQALLPFFTIDSDSKPNDDQVMGFVSEIGNRIAMRIGDLDALEAGISARATAMARGLVHLGAAAMAEDAGHPEQSGTPQGSSYGAVLWARFQTGLTELVALVTDAGGGGADAEGSAGSPTVTSPPPMFTSSMRW